MRVYLNVVSEDNLDLTGPQRELMLFHQKLGHIGMQHVQSLGRWSKRSNGVKVPSCLPVGHEAPMRSCPIPKFATCQMSKQHRRSPATVTRTTNITNQSRAVRFENNQENELRIGSLKEGDLLPGQCVSADQYLSALPGRLPHTRGKEPASKQYTGQAEPFLSIMPPDMFLFDFKSRGVLAIQFRASVSLSVTVQKWASKFSLTVLIIILSVPKLSTMTSSLKVVD